MTCTTFSQDKGERDPSRQVIGKVPSQEVTGTTLSQDQDEQDPSRQVTSKVPSQKVIRIISIQNKVEQDSKQQFTKMTTSQGVTGCTKMNIEGIVWRRTETEMWQMTQQRRFPF